MKKARDILRNKYKSGTVIDPSHINASIYGSSIKEYVHSGKGVNDDVYTAKLRASTELENLLNISTFEKTAPGNSLHPEYPNGWEYYTTVFKFGDLWLEGRVNIGITEKK